MKRILTFLLSLTFFITLTSCGSKQPNNFDINADWDSITSQANGQTVSFYGWGGDSELNKWIDNVLAKEVKEKYDITIKRVPMDIDDILAKLSGEKQAGKEFGTIDMIWINGENFYSTKENGMLFGPFTDKLPNFNQYIDSTKESSKYDAGFLIDGFEAPYGKAQFAFTVDTAKTKSMPKNATELLAFVKENKGKVTYPALPDFTGSAFVRTIIHDVVGYDKLNNSKLTKDEIKEIIIPAIDYLKELNPYLWNEGKTFPATLGQMDNMFADGELVLNMNYDPYSVNLKIEQGIYPNSCRSFIFEKGTVGNTNFIAIVNNAPNKAAAMVVINEVLTPKMQALKFEQVKLLSALDSEKLNTEEKSMFDKVDMDEGALDQSEILEKYIPELPANIWPLIEEIWTEEVVGK